MKTRPFIHLHVHSHYSVLDGQAKVADLVDGAISDGMKGIALTDHGVMYGIKDFLNTVGKRNAPHNGVIKENKALVAELEAKEESLSSDEEQQLAEARLKIVEAENKLFKPIVGCEAYCAKRTRHDKDPHEMDPYHPGRSIDRSGYHLIILAKNLTGYHNLARLVSASFVEGEYYKPRVDKELLEKYREGLIISSACLGGEIPQHIMAGRLDRASEAIEWFKGVFGDDYYLEIQLHQSNNPLGDQTIYPKQLEVAKAIMELSEQHQVKVIATNDIHFAREEDAEAHDRLICLNTGEDVDSPTRMRYSKQEWLKTQEQMSEIFQDYPNVLENTVEILDKVEYYSIDHAPLMPDFPIPEEFADADDYLRHLTYLGAEKKYGDALNDEVRERIDFELSVMKSMGFPGYFLIVQDFIAAARDMGVAVGPGRGSAAGSVVAYCLGITNIEPMRYHLLFERFLNPDRISMPDIDIDFDDDGRGKVLQYVTDKYGAEKVAHIVTYGKMAAKSALKDMARVEKVPLTVSNKMAGFISDAKMSITGALGSSHEFKMMSVGPDLTVRNSIKYAEQLEGTVRNIGVHACGIIIGQSAISDVVPVSTVKDNKTGEKVIITQYEGKVIEDTGLIKMDFLGLKNLSIINEALKNIKQTHGIDIDIDTIPLDDPKTFELYSNGQTIGTFQFESAGMQKYLRQLEPTCFEDLIAMNALYRPGPMENIPSFIARKKGIEKVEYPIDVMETYLKETYGITVYQEQVMLLSRLLANFTRGQSDSLRKAMGKKQKAMMDDLKVKFMAGGKSNGHDPKVLEGIWTQWEAFASYAFNKSHATCYSMVAYQTAYLKANYPSEYMAGAMSRNLSNADEIAKLMDESKAMGIEVLVPDVNESFHEFSVNKKGHIRFGLSAIKGVSQAAVRQLIEEREKNGPFKDIYDFFERVDLSSCNRKTLESFVHSGAFDSMELPREAYVSEGDKPQDENFLGSLIRYGNAYQNDALTGANSLFSTSEISIPKPKVGRIAEVSNLHKLTLERELIGVYLSANPLDEYALVLNHYCNTPIPDLNNEQSLLNKAIICGGIVTKVRTGISKNNSPYTIITLEDLNGTADIPLFGENHVNYGKYGIEGLYLLVHMGYTQHPFIPDRVSKNIQSIELLNEKGNSVFSEVHVCLPVEIFDEVFVEELKTVITSNAGKQKLFIEVVNNDSTVHMRFKPLQIAVGNWVSKFFNHYSIPFYIK